MKMFTQKIQEHNIKTESNNTNVMKFLDRLSKALVVPETYV